MEQENLQFQIQEKLLDFIADCFMVEKEEIDIDKSLVDAGIIDSFGLIEICVFIEKEFSFSIKETQLTRENFGSVTRIVEFIRKEIADRPQRWESQQGTNSQSQTKAS